MPRVLLIDDEDQLRRMLRQVLEQEGYEVIEARDGAEGIKNFCTSPVDLLITDILMPEREGLELIRELRREYPSLKIIAISGGGQMGKFNFLDVAKIFGAQRIFQKPFPLQEFLQGVREVLAAS